MITFEYTPTENAAVSCTEVKVSLTSDNISLDDVIEAFESFLKGTGYFVPNGARLDWVYDEPCGMSNK